MQMNYSASIYFIFSPEKKYFKKLNILTSFTLQDLCLIWHKSHSNEIWKKKKLFLRFFSYYDLFKESILNFFVYFEGQILHVHNVTTHYYLTDLPKSNHNQLPTVSKLVKEMLTHCRPVLLISTPWNKCFQGDIGKQHWAVMDEPS